MERLTKRYNTHIAVVCENCDKRLECNGGVICGEVLRDRLASYEDTGLEPEDIEIQSIALTQCKPYVDAICDEHGKVFVSPNRLAELAKAEKDGRLVVLPCKPGQMVWAESPVRGRAYSFGAPGVEWIIENADRLVREIFWHAKKPRRS